MHGSNYILFIIIFFIAFFMFFVIFHIANDDNINVTNCKLLGSARDLPQVKFFDCDGEVQISLTKELNNK